MVFSDLQFVFLFLPLFLFVYFLIPAKAKNAFVFLASLAFYTLGTLDRPAYALLLAGAVGLTYGAGRLMDTGRFKKPVFILSLALLFGLLFLFKYEGFFISMLNRLLRVWDFSLPVLDWVLPVGISFYTFQAVSYLADVYTGKCRAERSLIRFGAYLTMFPQLVAGPIVKYVDIRQELLLRRHSLAQFAEGCKLFVIGLGYKVLLANNVAGLFRKATAMGYESISSPMAWLAAVAFSFQLYFDFFGYSLMAKGMGRMMGFTIPDNFLHPYTARNMTDFWRRWHVTLSSWFKEYVYIPLGGSRKGKWRTVRNLFVVWAFTGLWHGASLNFLLGGMVLFAVLVVERLGWRKITDRLPVLGHAYMILLIPVTWAIFAITDLGQLGTFLLRMFPFLPQTAEVIRPDDFLIYGREYGLMLLACLFFCTRLPSKIYARARSTWWMALLLAAVFGLSVYCLCQGLNDPFLYFRF